MSDKNTDKELSMDELKDVAGGGMGLDRLGTQKVKGVGPTDDAADIHAPTPLSASSKGRYSVSGDRDVDSNDVVTNI